jgi:NADPH:quinone reductase-like Zn-dependent oxidoreductase
VWGRSCARRWIRRENVSILTFADCSGRSQPANNQLLWIATSQPSASETLLGHRDLLWLLSVAVRHIFLVSSLRLAEILRAPDKDPKRVSEVWTELLALFASGRLKPAVYDGHYTLETLTQGLRDLEDRTTWGKAVVRIREPAARGRL